MSILLGHNPYKQFGGEDVVFTSEVDLLRNRGHEVHKLVIDNRDLSKWKLPKVAVDSVWSRSCYRKTRNLISEKNVHIAHFVNTFPQLSPSVYYACSELSVPVVQSVNNYRLFCPAATFWRDGHLCEECVDSLGAGIRYGCYRDSRNATATVALMLWFHRQLGTWQNAVSQYIVPTHFMKDKLAEAGLPPEKISVRNNFIVNDPGTGDHDGNYVLYVGRLAEEKGVLTLLDAWTQLEEEIPLRIVGDGPRRKEMEELVACSSLDSVDLVGHVDHEEVFELMKKASFLVFPSEWYEGMPLTLIEAFGTGLPVVGSNIGAMEEMLTDEAAGLQFEAGNEGELAERVEWLWRRETARLRMGEAARTRFLERYTPTPAYERLIEIYDQILAVG